MASRSVYKQLIDRFHGKENFDHQGLRSFNHIVAGGLDFGELLVTLSAVEKDGDVEAWHNAFNTLLERTNRAINLPPDGDWSKFRLAQRRSASTLLLRSVEAARQAEFFLRGEEDDLRRQPLCATMRRNFKLFLEATGLDHQVVEEENFMGVFIRPERQGSYDSSTGKPACLVLPSGYDSFAEEGYFFSGKEALERGWSVLLLDGPGQGHMLRERKVPMTPHYENVLKEAYEWVIASDVDPKRVAVCGRSLAGYLVLQGAAAWGKDCKLAGIILDPAQPELLSPQGIAKLPGFKPEIVEAFHQGDANTVNTYMNAVLDMHPALKFWCRSRWECHNITDMYSYLKEMTSYSCVSNLSNLSIPVLCVENSNETISNPNLELVTKHVSSHLLHTEYFGLDDGSLGHCEQGANTRFAERCFDWLDKVFVNA